MQHCNLELGCGTLYSIFIKGWHDDCTPRKTTETTALFVLCASLNLGCSKPGCSTWSPTQVSGGRRETEATSKVWQLLQYSALQGWVSRQRGQLHPIPHLCFFTVVLIWVEGRSVQPLSLSFQYIPKNLILHYISDILEALEWSVSYMFADLHNYKKKKYGYRCFEKKCNEGKWNSVRLSPSNHCGFLSRVQKEFYCPKLPLAFLYTGCHQWYM